MRAALFLVRPSFREARPSSTVDEGRASFRLNFCPLPFYFCPLQKVNLTEACMRRLPAAALPPPKPPAVESDSPKLVELRLPTGFARFVWLSRLMKKSEKLSEYFLPSPPPGPPIIIIIGPPMPPIMPPGRPPPPPGPPPRAPRSPPPPPPCPPRRPPCACCCSSCRLRCSAAALDAAVSPKLKVRPTLRLTEKKPGPSP